MLTRNLISNAIPSLHKTDTVYHALQLMNDYHVAQLPVVEEETYEGIVSEEQLLLMDEEALVEEIPMEEDAKLSVQANEHFLKAVQTAVVNKLTIVPVVEERVLIGTITCTDLLRNTADFMSINQPGALLVLEMDNRSYTFGEVARIVEANDAQITQLNTSTDPETGLMEVTLRFNKMEVSDLVSAFQRYEYNVKHYFGEELYENELKANYEHLMHYLKV